MDPEPRKVDIPFAKIASRSAKPVTLEIDGHAVIAGEEDTVASAILLAGALPNRLSAVNGEPRVPYCMMGACFECLAEVDGVPERQTCLIPVRDGMRVRTVRGRER